MGAGKMAEQQGVLPEGATDQASELGAAGATAVGALLAQVETSLFWAGNLFVTLGLRKKQSS